MKVIKYNIVLNRKLVALITPSGGVAFPNRDNKRNTVLDLLGEAFEGDYNFEELVDLHGWVKIYEGESITITF